MTKYAIKNYLSRKFRASTLIKHEQTKILLILFLASFLLVINYFITPGRLVQGVDALMWVTHTKYYSNSNWMYSWYDKASLGFVRIPSLLNMLLGISNTVIREPSWVYRTAILAIIFLANFGIYKYIKHLTNDSDAGLIGALFYTLNPWFISEVGEGHIDILAGLGLFPLFLFALEKRDAVLTSILGCMLLTSAHPQTIYAFGLLSIAYIFATFNWNRMKQNVTFLSGAFVLVLGLSMFYVVPFTQTNGFYGYSGLKPWTIEDVSGFVMPFWQVAICLIPVLSLAILTLKYRKEFKHSAFFAILAVLATLIAVSPSFPVLDTIYFWMFRNVPFFSIFRVPARFMMVTIFCMAYMIGVVTSKSKSSISEVKVPFHGKPVPKGRIYRTIIAGSIIVTFVISSLLLPLSSPGNYTPSSEWISNYEWLGNKPEEFWNVYTLPVTSGWILTPYGPTQDYGTLSTLFSDKSVIGVPAKTATSYAFLKYLEHLVQDNVTDQWLKLLGAINVKYVTCSPIIGTQRDFLIRQEGITEELPVYTDGDAEVYDNPYWTPMFKATSDLNLFAGGYDTVLSLLRLSFNFSNSGLRFVHAEENLDTANYTSIIYENLMDYLMVTLDEGIRIHAYRFGADYTTDPKKDWIKDGSWKIEGKFVLNDFTLSISEENTLAIPFEAGENGIYEIFVRTLAAPALDRGELTVGNITIQPIWSDYTFKWYDFGTMEVATGQNVLQLRNSGERNDVDEIVLVKQEGLEQTLRNEMENLSTKKIIFTNRAYNLFDITMDRNWTANATQFDCDGDVLHSNDGGELRLNLAVGNVELFGQGITLPKAGNYTLLLRANTTGNVLFQIDNETSLAVGSGEYEQYKFSLPFLDEGIHNLQLLFDRKADLDQITVYSTSESNGLTQDLFSNEGNSNIITALNKINPTEYVINATINMDDTYLTVVTSYDYRWKMFINETQISPTRINDGIIGFALNQTGSFQMRLVFTGQVYMAQGFYITLVSCSAILTIIAFRYEKGKKRKDSNAGRRILAIV